MIQSLYDLQKEFDDYLKPPKPKKTAKKPKNTKKPVKQWKSIIPVK